MIKEYIEKSYVLYLLNYFGSMMEWSKEDVILECKRYIEECEDIIKIDSKKKKIEENRSDKNVT